MNFEKNDLIEIVYNSQFKFKGYFLEIKKTDEKRYEILIEDFILGKKKWIPVDEKTIIRNKKKIKNYIYCITCVENGKKYIGRTCNSVEQRFTNHFAESKNPYPNTPLHNDMLKYGKEKFIVETLFEYYADRQKEANKIEQDFIKNYNTAYPNGYNISVFEVKNG